MKNFITIGTFDGVHRGHARLFDALKKEAAAAGMEPCIFYFPLPPKTLIADKKEMTVLTLPDEKEELLRVQGVKKIFPLKFSLCRNFASEEFLDSLISQYNMGGLLAGKDFAMGKDRAGHIDAVRKICAARGVKFAEMDFFNDDGHKISSSIIRQNILRGNIDAANALLGYKYFVEGKVIKGEQLGRKLGFPTANLDVGIYKALPQGIFAVEVSLGKEKFKGVTNIGFRPTVNPVHADVPLVEAHILNFSRDIYGENLKINFVSKIRAEKKFDGLEELKAAIRLDAAQADILVNI